MLARLPHIRQLLLQLVKHGRAKEVEQLCVGLMHMCTLLPLQAAQQLSAWTLDCCELDHAQACLARSFASKLVHVWILPHAAHAGCKGFVHAQLENVLAARALFALHLEHAGRRRPYLP